MVVFVGGAMPQHGVQYGVLDHKPRRAATAGQGARIARTQAKDT